MSETTELIKQARGGVSKEISAHMHKQDKRIAELESFIRRYRYNIGGEHQLLIDKILGEALGGEDDTAGTD